MRKTISIILAISTIFLLSSCSRESKFGVGEFFDRAKIDFELEIEESSIYLEKNDSKNRIYCTCNSFFLVLYLGVNDNVCGVASILPNERKNEIASFINNFQKCVSLLTGNTSEETEKTLNKLNISADKIEFADNNLVCTVGKYKYSVITNEMSITLFCERV